MAHWREKLNQHKPLLTALGAAAAVLAIALLVWLACVRPELGKGYTERISDDYTSATTLGDGVTATQIFTYDNSLLAVAVEFELPSGPTSGELSLRLCDADTGEELAVSTGVLEYIVPGQYTVLGLDREVPATPGRRYALHITPHYTGWATLAIGHSTGVALWSEPLLVDGIAVDGTLALQITAKRIGGYLTRFFLLISAGAALLVFVGVFSALRHKLRLDKLVFVLVLGFGLLYSMVLPPYAAPDEKYHINQSFTLAAQWANRLSPDDWVMGHVPTTQSFRREHDFDPLLQDENTTVFTWQQYTDNLLSTTTDPFDSHVELDELQTDQNPLLYLASGAAVFLGFVLHLGFAPTLALGRLANLLLFAALAALAVRRTPFGKRIFMAAALLPMTLHLAASFSRDAPLLGLAFAFTALFLEAAFGPERDRKLTLRGLLPLLVFGLLLAPGKLVYLPLAALFLALPAVRLGRRPWLKKGGYLAACLLLGVVLNQGTLTTFLPATVPNAGETAAAADTDTDADTDEPAAKSRPDQPLTDYEQRIIFVNTPESFVRRLYYFAEDNAAPADSEVAFWCQALAEGDVTPLVLGQSFFFSPDKAANGYLDGADFCTEVSLVYIDRDMIEFGDDQFVPLFEAEGAEVAFKALLAQDSFQTFLNEAGLEVGTVMDDRIPLDREVLAQEITEARATRATQSLIDEADAHTYSPGYLLTHLPDTVLLITRTAVQDGDTILQQLVGGKLSYSSLSLAWGWVVLLFVLLAYAALPARAAAQLTGRGRVYIALAGLACCALVLLGCILWTPTHYQTIYGLQGRYLLPVLPALLLSCMPRRAVVEDEQAATATLTCLLCVAQAGVLMNMMLAVMAR